MITQVINVDYAQVGHSMMIGAKCNQVIEGVSTARANGGDVMDVDVKVKATDYTPIAISHHGLFFDKAPLAAAPVPIQVRYFGDARAHANPIAVVPFLDLAWEFVKRAATMGARNGHAVSASRFGRHALPLYVTLALAACYLVFAAPFLEGVTAYGAGVLFFAAPVMAVVLAAVLMGIDVSVLALFARDNFATTTSTVKRFLGVVCCCHKSIIHAYKSSRKHTLALAARGAASCIAERPALQLAQCGAQVA